SIARFLAFRFGHTERSFFRQVRELPPAHFLEVSPTGVRVEPYWRFRRRSSARSRSPEEIRGAFLGHLRSAVESDVADLEPEQVAVSLSGGLDSTAVAALAPRGVHTFSWTLVETPEGDERASVEAVARWLSLRHEWVRGDGHYPLAGDFVDRFVGESSPYVNAFAGLKAALYSVARARGCERVLVGDGGDTLYAAREYWLRDALATGRPWAIVSLLRTIQGAVRDENGLARAALARLLLVRNLRNKLRGDHVPWLTKMARSAVPRSVNAPILPSGRGAARYELSVGAKHVELESEERRLFDLCGVDRGNPFWSWPLLEMAIQLPAYWHHRDGRNKVLSREALRGLLPKEVLESPRIGLLGTFFLRGIELRRDDLRQTVFRHPRSDWQRFVRREWLEPFLENTGAIAFGHTILWRVICYELWTRRLVGAV
ncbi:MAG TPA: asparagine synthetase B family protein, partial [Thermoanaerobaculia bacterium]|nr:asparagine synthetase B family protein [Thermoanaerobaculia bacterium]